MLYKYNNYNERCPCKGSQWALFGCDKSQREPKALVKTILWWDQSFSSYL